MEAAPAIGLGLNGLKFVFIDLFNAVSEKKNKLKMFKSELADLEKTLTALQNVTEQLDKLNNALGHRKEELDELIELLKKGTELVNQCSKISKINIIKKLKYEKKLRKLDESLERFFKFLMQAQMARDIKDLAIDVKHQLGIVRRLEKLIMMGFCNSVSSDPEGSAFVINNLSLKDTITSVADKVMDIDYGNWAAIDEDDQEMEDINSLLLKPGAKSSKRDEDYIPRVFPGISESMIRRFQRNKKSNNDALSTSDEVQMPKYIRLKEA